MILPRAGSMRSAGPRRLSTSPRNFVAKNPQGLRPRAEFTINGVASLRGLLCGVRRCPRLRRTADDDYVQEEEREVNVPALIFITVALVVMFV